MQILQIALKYMIILALFLPLSGCWDKKELEERAYVIGIGLDKNKRSDKLDITFLIANPEIGSQQTGGANSQEPAKEILTIAANDFVSARNTANAIIARELTYDLLRVIVVSEDMAKENNFIRYMYDATKDREIRRDAHLIVTKEKARVFFEKNKPKLETRPHKYFQFMINRGIMTGLIPDSDLHRFFRVTENHADLFLAMYATTEKNEKEKPGNEDEYVAGEISTEGTGVKGGTSNVTQFIGSAVFREGKMIGTINGQETRISMVLDETSDISDVLTTYPDPFHKKFRLAARLIKKEKNDVELTIKNGVPKITVKVPLTIEILSDPGMTNYATNNKNKKILKRTIEKDLNDMTDKFIKKTQEKFKGEPFMWSAYARKKFTTIDAYEKYNWLKKYPDAQVNVKVNVTFGEFGKQAKIPEIGTLRD